MHLIMGNTFAIRSQHLKQSSNYPKDVFFGHQREQSPGCHHASLMDRATAAPGTTPMVKQCGDIHL